MIFVSSALHTAVFFYNDGKCQEAHQIPKSLVTSATVATSVQMLKETYRLTNDYSPASTSHHIFKQHMTVQHKSVKKGEGRPCSITERRFPELIPVIAVSLQVT